MSDLFLEIQRKVHQAPLFFKSAPLIISLYDEDENELDLEQLQSIISFLEQYHCRPIGWVGPCWVEKIAHFFKCAYWPTPVPSGRSDFAKIINEPLRAGSSIYHPGDIILLAPSHESSEVLAGGNIHCYSSAHGRLLAGVRGNKDSKIFCLNLNAQLISIAGVFQTQEQYQSLKGPVKIELWNNALKINGL